MRLFMLDLVRRRHRWIAPLLMGVLIPIWWLGGAAVPAAQALVFSMGVAFAVGPQLMNPSLMPRALWYLPISRRDVWRATWLLSTVGATLFTTAAKLLGTLLPGSAASFTLATVALSAVYDFAYTGLGCGLIIVATRPRPAGGLSRLTWPCLKGAAEFLLPFAALAGMFGGRFIGHALPLRWSEITARGGALLAAALVVSVATYFHTPGPAARAIRPLGPQPRQTATSRSGRMNGLTGLPRLLMQDYVRTGLASGGLVVMFGLLVFVVGALMQSPASYGEFLRMEELMLFDEGSRQARGVVFDLIIWCGLFAATLASMFPGMLRHLRVLPLGAARLNMLLVAWPALMLLTVWSALMGVHYVVLGPPVESLQPALFVALVGSTAIMRAVKLKWPGASPWLFPLAIGVGATLRLVYGPSSALFVILGLGGMAAAVAFSHDALLRSSTYRHTVHVLGIVAPQPWR